MKKLLFILLCILAGVQTTKAQEAYACYTPSNTTLTFYYDNLKESREGTTYFLNTGDNTPAWYSLECSITNVVFDESFVAARPTSTYCWFYGMRCLASISGLEYLNTSNVTTMQGMFGNCILLRNLDVSHFNTKNVSNMSGMFFYCNDLRVLDLSSFNTAKVTDMSSMFEFCSNLITIYVGDGWSTKSVTNSEQMFPLCNNLVGGKGTVWNSSHVNAEYARIDGGPDSETPGYFTAGLLPYVVYTADDHTLTFYYDRLIESREDPTYFLNTGNNNPAWSSVKASITDVVFDESFAAARPTSTFNWFSGIPNLENITNIKYLYTDEVTNMGMMFASCTSLTTLDLSNWNTAKVTNMSYMFNNCFSLLKIYVGDGWTTIPNVTSSDQMFTFCVNLIGGKGTSYDPENPMDATYAHLDGGTDNPGYFMEKLGEAYAVYTDNNNTLTFYCDFLKESREGTSYDLNIGDNNPGWKNDGNGRRVVRVVFDPSFANARPTSTYNWFSHMTMLSYISGLKYLNTCNVTTMYGMFDQCSRLLILDVSNFNTKNVRNMSAMFNGCRMLTALDLSSFNTANVLEMDEMFGVCTNLTTIYVGDGWSMESVNTSANMFTNCLNLVGGNGTAFAAGNTGSNYARIDDPYNGKPGYFTDASTREAYAVYNTEKTLTFYYDNLKGSREGTTYDLNTDDSVPAWYDDGDGDGINANVFTVAFHPLFVNARPTSTHCWFLEMENLTGIAGLERLNTSEVTDMGGMFSQCSNLTILDVSNFDTGKVTTMNGMFEWCSNITSLDLSHFDTGNVTMMDNMFSNCSNLETLDLSSFNTEKVFSMPGMFSYCNNLTTIIVSEGWSTERVAYSYEMFINSPNLEGGAGTIYQNENPVDKTYARIDGGPSAPGYFTAKVVGEPEIYAVLSTDRKTLSFFHDGLKNYRPGTKYVVPNGRYGADWWFDDSINDIETVYFDTSFADVRPTYTFSWFKDMGKLATITGIENLNTSEVTDMGQMFCNCPMLTSLDLSSFNTKKVTNMSEAFKDCINLVTVEVGGGWSTANVTMSDDMFSSCTSIVGGKGTTFDENHIDKGYAHIDGGTENPGYFSVKPPFIPGDSNGDWTVSVADAVAVVAYLLNPSVANINLDAADVDGVEGVTIGDVQAIVNMILNKTE